MSARKEKLQTLGHNDPCPSCGDLLKVFQGKFSLLGKCMGCGVLYKVELRESSSD